MVNRESCYQRRKNIASYNALRGICALGIFCHHNSYLAEASNPFWQQLYNYFLKYGSRCTSFFFLMSGFLLAYTWRNVPFGSFMKGKLKRLYPLTLLVLILAIGCSFILNNTVNGNMAIGSPMWILSLVLNLTLIKAFIPVEDVFYSFHGPSWYISVLFVFYIVGYFVVKKLKQAEAMNHVDSVVDGKTWSNLKPVLKLGGGVNHDLSVAACYLHLCRCKRAVRIQIVPDVCKSLFPNFRRGDAWYIPV